MDLTLDSRGGDVGLQSQGFQALLEGALSDLRLDAIGQLTEHRLGQIQSSIEPCLLLGLGVWPCLHAGAGDLLHAHLTLEGRGDSRLVHHAGTEGAQAGLSGQWVVPVLDPDLLQVRLYLLVVLVQQHRLGLLGRQVVEPGLVGLSCLLCLLVPLLLHPVEHGRQGRRQLCKSFVVGGVQLRSSDSGVHIRIRGSSSDSELGTERRRCAGHCYLVEAVLVVLVARPLQLFGTVA